MARKWFRGRGLSRIAQTYPQLAVQLAGTHWGHSELTSVRTAYELAATLFAAAERGSAKPFVDHLVGTASAVIIGGGPAPAVAAALLHAAYDQGDFGDGRNGPHTTHRKRIRATVGDTIENLVYRYNQLGWSPTVAEHALRDVDHATPQMRSVLLIRIANEIDDATDGGLVLSAKQHLAVHSEQTRRIAVRLAEHIGTPEFAALAQHELFDPPPVFPPELIVGTIRSRTRLPASTSRRPALIAARTIARTTRLAKRFSQFRARP